MLEIGNVYDSSEEGYPEGIWMHLPHSCDDWVIGGKKQVQELIADLQELLNTPMDEFMVKENG